ncbi:MAG: nitroreductase family protein [Planctomycetota bacterium]
MDPLRNRRSIRKYTDKPVDDEVIRNILELTMTAPSAGDQRPWHFIVIRDREKLEALSHEHPYASMAKHAPVAILVCADLQLLKYENFWVQDCAAATENLLLAATAEGLGSTWVGVYPVEDRRALLRRLCELPDHVEPFALVPLGHPAERKGPAERYNDLRVHKEVWQG